MKVIFSSLLFIALFSSHAQASLIQNGSFDQCADPAESFCLDGWETFLTDPTNSDFDRIIPSDPIANPGVFFNAGRISNTFPSGTSLNQGGGIRQSFDFTGGDLNIDIFFNAFFDGVGSSARGIIDAVLIGPGSVPAITNSFDLADAGRRASDASGTITLQSVTNLLSGIYTLEVSFTRAFLLNSDVLFGLTNIDATSQAGGLNNGGGVVEASEPNALLVLLAGIIGIAVFRQKKKI